VNGLLYYDPSAPSVTDFSGVPKGYLAQGAGDFIYRQSWTDLNTTVLVFESGSLGQSHISDDANGLLLWKGTSWVSANANIYSNSGIEQATANYNNLTVGGEGQKAGFGIGKIVGTPFLSDTLVVIRGQAANAYGYPPGIGNGLRPVTDYLRTVTYLPVQDAVIVVDRVTVVDSTQAKVWHWHSLNPAVVNGNTFTLVNPAGTQRCVATVLLPTTAALASASLAANTDLHSNVVTVTLPVAAKSDMMVTVFQCSAQSATSATVTASGVSVLVGAKRVAVPTDPTQLVTVQ
jgi:hypothetical protein